MRTLGAALALVSLLGLGGCRTAAIYTPIGIPLPSASNPRVTLDEVTKGILAAGKSKGWVMQEQGPGEIVASQTAGRHVAVVTVTYDTMTFAIRYRDSKVLMHQGNDIHKRYNTWVKNLETAILEEMKRRTAQA